MKINAEEQERLGSKRAILLQHLEILEPRKSCRKVAEGERATWSALFAREPLVCSSPSLSSDQLFISQAVEKSDRV